MRVELCDVSVRDGLQSEGETWPTARKLELIRRVANAGVPRIEVASFAHPKHVPQMADAEQVIDGLPWDSGVHFTALVLNRRGLDRAAATAVKDVGFVLVVTESFSRRNQNMGVAEALDSWRDIAERARQLDLRAHVILSAAFGCPFEGDVPEPRVLEIVQTVLAEEPSEICLADTIGAAAPAQVDRLVRETLDRAGQVPVRVHFHNTRNTGLANCWAAWQAGIRSMDASLGGIGGCPFAPAATGNVPLDDLAYLFERSGVDTGIELSALLGASEWLAAQFDRTLPALLPRAGLFPPTRSTGFKEARTDT